MSLRPILITGATGFVGRHLVESLLRRRCDLILAVRKASRCPPHWLGNGCIRLIEIDGQAPAEILNIDRIETVVHLAGLAHVRETTVSAEAFERSNAQLTAQFAEASLRSGTRRFIHLSSVAAITSSANSSIVSDTVPEAPQTLYGKAKRAAEMHVRSLVAKGIFAISLRPPLVVGADAKGNWARLQALAYTGLPLPFASIGNQRNLIGIDALAEIIASLCFAPPEPQLSGEYVVANPAALSLPEILLLLRQGMNLPGRLFVFPTDALRFLGSATGLGVQVSSLVDDFRIDASRFFSVFPYCRPGSIREEIERSGFEYARSRRH